MAVDNVRSAKSMGRSDINCEWSGDYFFSYGQVVFSYGWSIVDTFRFIENVISP